MKKFLMLCLTALCLSSCVTKYLWGDKSYDEQILQFFVGEDGRYVVLASQEYHYVFSDNSGLLKNILSLEQKGVLTVDMKKSYLKLGSNNEVSGYLIMRGPFSVLPNGDKLRISAMGLQPDKNDVLTIKINLNGRRYAARYLGSNLPTPSILKTIKIYYSDSGAVKDVGKVAVTPIAVTLDAALLIGKIVIYPFGYFYGSEEMKME